VRRRIAGAISGGLGPARRVGSHATAGSRFPADPARRQGGALGGARAPARLAVRRLGDIGARGRSGRAPARRAALRKRDCSRSARRQVDPAGRRADPRDHVSVLPRLAAAGTDLRPVPGDEHDGRDDDLHDDGPRPELRRGVRGLLDLGYVAFYAMGAYMAGLVRRRSSPTRTSTSAPSASTRARPGTTSRSGSSSRWPASQRRSSACSSACRRCGLRGDYLAIVTLGFGEIMPQIARNGSNLFGSTSRTAPGDHADRRAGLRQLGRAASAPAGQLPRTRRTTTRCSSGRRSCSC
jgi:ABC-type branched-chain amino acid transport system, permease component